MLENAAIYGSELNPIGIQVGDTIAPPARSNMKGTAMDLPAGFRPTNLSKSVDDEELDTITLLKSKDLTNLKKKKRKHVMYFEDWISR